MMQIIIYAIGVSIGLLISSILLISVTTGKKRSKRNKSIRIIAADIIIAAIMLLLYPYHIKEVKSISIQWTLPVFITVLLNIIAINKLFSGERPNQEILNAWHDNPANWKFGILYYNPDDHRIFPPKKIEGFGWTINFANPYSILVMTGILVLFFFLITYLETIYS